MPNDRSSKQSRAEISDLDSHTPVMRNDISQPQLSSSDDPPGPSQDPSTPPRRSPVFSPSMDTATEKLDPHSPINLALLRLPSPHENHPYHRPASRHSHEEFRQRLIRTIDEALRIMEDDSDFQMPTNIRKTYHED